MDVYSRFRTFLRRHHTKLPDAKAQITFWSLLAAGLALDLWSKKAVFDRWAIGESHTVINGLLSLAPTVNSGAAFGICAGQSFFLTAASVLALVVVFAYFFFSGTEHRLVHIAIGLLAAGICGNLYDRIFNDGLVQDFIDVVYWPGKHWPAFNVADALLCIGVWLLIILTAFTGKSAQKHAQQQK